jgi:hypothetical protein
MMAVQRAGSEGGRKPISINVRKGVSKYLLLVHLV